MSESDLRCSYDVVPETCNHCGHALAGLDPAPHRHQVVDLPAIQAVVDEWRLHTLACAACGNKTRAALPPGVPNCGFGSGVDGVVAALTGMCRLSKRTTSTLMGDLFGVTMCTGSVIKSQVRVAEALERPHAELHEFVKSRTVKHCDETPWLQQGKRTWLWTVVTTFATVFRVLPDRSTRSAVKMLGDGAGVLTSDRAGAYEFWKTLLRQLCWAHLERDFRAIASREGPAGELGGALLKETQRMWGWWRRLKAGELLRTTFKVYMRGLRGRVEGLLKKGMTLEHPKTRRTCKKIWNLRRALWTFVGREDVEPTNNAAEQAIRFAVLWRKMCFGTQSESGSRFVERISTVVATLTKQGRSVVDYLRQVVGAHRSGGELPSMIPVAAT